MVSFLYNILIYPIELVLEFVFSVVYGFRHNAGLSIIGVSIVMNLLLLPLYNRAEQIAAKERSRQKEMQPWVDHIRSSFKGDERFLILSAYYRKQDYHPLYALKSSISLMLQVPFFIAAYHFLSHLSLLNGIGFLWIRNLGEPDQLIFMPETYLNLSSGMIPIGAASVNLLPILMTLINVLSCLAYTKDSSFREKLQLYAMALIFLVLLYKSPSGLVLYWTMNNLFSLAKNIITLLAGKRKKKEPDILPVDTEDKAGLPDPWILFGSLGLLLTILIGLVIPSAVISASPSEFISPSSMKDPVRYILNTGAIAAGTYLLWFSIFYAIVSPKAKRRFCLILWLLSSVFLIDYLAFGKNTVNLSPELIFDQEPVFTGAQTAFNLAVVALGLSVFAFVWKKYRRIIPMICAVLSINLIIMTLVNTIGIERVMAEEKGLIEAESPASKHFTLSRSGRNVIVIMMDRAIGGYVPYLMQERPQLLDQFAGFTWYPNTISFGNYTVFGSPALFGGYEYTVDAINRRDGERLVDKHDEALCVMPVLFSQNHFSTTVYDPPYANYKGLRDLSIYDPWPDIHAFHLKEAFADQDYLDALEHSRKRSFFMYSIYKVSPLALHPFFYNNGTYFNADVQNAANAEFDNDYAILENMDFLTDITDKAQDTFMMMDNECTHDTCELQLPDYTPSLHTNNSGLEPGFRVDAAGNVLNMDPEYHYHDLMAAFIQLGNWMDYLRENGVYDNTRIILVSDHGRGLNQFGSLIQEDGTDMEWVYPLLMVKDFGSREWRVSNEFMTNADTPVLASKGLIDHPVNPFTGLKLNDDEKTSHDQRVVLSDLYDILKDNTADMTRFNTSDGVWYAVHDDIFQRENWTKIEEPRD